MRFRSRNSKATIVGTSGTVLAGVWRIYSWTATATQLPADASKVNQFLADPPTWLPWAFLVFCIAVLAWSLWPSDAEPEGAAHGPQTTHAPYSHNIGSVGTLTINHPSPPAFQPVKSPYGSALPYALDNSNLERGNKAPREGLGTKEVKPDLNLNGLLVRVYKQLGPPPQPDDSNVAHAKFWMTIDRAVADKMALESLHSWGRPFPTSALKAISQWEWQSGTFNHKMGDLRVPTNFGSITYTDLHFCSSEAEKFWPKE